MCDLFKYSGVFIKKTNKTQSHVFLFLKNQKDKKQNKHPHSSLTHDLNLKCRTPLNFSSMKLPVKPPLSWFVITFCRQSSDKKNTARHKSIRQAWTRRRYACRTSCLIDTQLKATSLTSTPRPAGGTSGLTLIPHHLNKKCLR